MLFRFLLQRGALVLSVTACGVEARTLPELPAATAAEVRVESRTRATIRDSARLAALVQFINARRTHWTVPWYGVPVGKYGVTLYRGAAVLGSFNAGSDFFETQQAGGFFSQAADSTQLGVFRGLLGADLPPDVAPLRHGT